MSRHHIPNRQLIPLQRLSPSRFDNMNLCNLQGVWTSTYDPLFPIFPTMRIGFIIHKILELYSKGIIDLKKYDQHLP